MRASWWRAGAAALVVVGACATAPAERLAVPLFVDRIEGPLAVVIWAAEEHVVPLDALPLGAREGAWLSLSVDGATTTRMRRRARDLLRRLSRDDPGGSWSL